MNFLRALILSLLLAVNSFAVDTVWNGAAQALPQTQDVTIAGTWAQNDLASVTCNFKSVTVTVGTNISVSDVAAALAAAINSGDSSVEESDLVGDESKNIGGQNYGEFMDFKATVSAGVITLTSTTDGHNFTVTVSKTSTSGTITLEAVSQAATGPEWWDNSNNWVDGAVPVEDERAILTGSSENIYFGIDNLNDDLDIMKLNSFTGNVGLPMTNTWHSGKSYPEYRNRVLTSAINNATGIIITLGEKEPRQSLKGWFYVSLGAGSVTSNTLHVYGAAGSTSDGAGVQIQGGNDIKLYLFNGTVSIGTEPAGVISEINIIDMTNGDLWVGDNSKIAVATTSVVQRGGRIHWEVGPTAGADLDTYTILGGTSSFWVGRGITNLYIYDGGVAEYIIGVGTILSCWVYPGGTFTTDKANQGGNITNVGTFNIYKGARVLDKNNFIYKDTVKFNFIDTWPGDPATTFEGPPSRRWSYVVIP